MTLTERILKANGKKIRLTTARDARNAMGLGESMRKRGLRVVTKAEGDDVLVWSVPLGPKRN